MAGDAPAAGGTLTLRRDKWTLAAGKQMAERLAEQRGFDAATLHRRGLVWRGARRGGRWEWRPA